MNSLETLSSAGSESEGLSSSSYLQQDLLMEDESMSLTRWLTADEALNSTLVAPPMTATPTSPLQLFSTIMSNILLFFLIFGLSATVDLRSMKSQLQNKFAIGLGVAMQFVIMPILGFLSVLALRDYGLTFAMSMTLLVVTSSPGGSYSNWWCSTFNADLALSVAMTTVSSILSVGLLPANLFLYTYLAFGTSENNVLESLDFRTIFMTLGIVMAAILSGLFCGYKWDNPRFHVWSNRFGSVSGLLLIIFSLFLSSGADGADSNFWNQPWAFYVGVAVPCLVGMALANIISRMKCCKLAPAETVAIAIECCYQNTGIATSVAITMFQDKNQRAQAVAVPLFYGIVEAIAIGLYCVWAWKVGWTKAPKDENLCVVMTKTYEVVEEPEEGEGQEVEYDPEAAEYWDENSQEFSESGEPDQFVVEADEAEEETSSRVIPGHGGFWASLLPAGVLRWTSSVFGRSSRSRKSRTEENEQDTEDLDKKHGMPKSAPARLRLNTADTSVCSGVSGRDSLATPRSPVDPLPTPRETRTATVRLGTEVVALELPHLEERIEDSSEEITESTMDGDLAAAEANHIVLDKEEEVEEDVTESS